MRHNSGCLKSGRMFMLLAACHLAGCGPTEPERETAPVAGKVTYQGQPLKLGTVMFQPSSGAFTLTQIQPDGTYSLQAVIGPNQVLIVSREEGQSAVEGQPHTRQATKHFIPEKYGMPNSTLKFEVKAGRNTADFTLEE